MINEFRPMNHLTSLQNFICTIGNLPTSYALSLSYEEQIWWLCDFLEKKVFPAIEENTNITEETQQAFIELQQYVTDYFNNLDVQEEINNKLDEMTESGVLSNIIGSYITPLIDNQNNRILNFENQVENAIEIQNNKIDSLTNISPIPVDNISDMTDNSKIYVLTSDNYWYYYNGTTFIRGGIYQSSGISDNSIFGNKLQKNINALQDMEYLLANKKAIKPMNTKFSVCGINVNGELNTQRKDRLTTYYIDTLNNVIAKPFGNTTYFINIYNKVLKTGNIDFSNINFQKGEINDSTGSVTNDDFHLVSDFFEVTEETKKLCFDKFIFFGQLAEYSKSDSSLVNIYTYSTQSDDIPDVLNPNYKYRLLIRSDNRVIDAKIKNDMLQALNNNYYATELVGQIYKPSTWYNDALTINDNNYLYRLCMQNSNILTFDNIPNLDIKNYILLYNKSMSPLYNKRVSVLGDSFSAYISDIPANLNAYYNGSNAGVNSNMQMWYNRLINNNGCNKGIINASSGSSISNIGASSSNIPFSDDSRCLHLATQDGNPDIIIILGGTNDFSHANPNLRNIYRKHRIPNRYRQFQKCLCCFIVKVSYSIS